MLVNDGQGPDRGRSANCVRSRRSAHSPFVPSSLYHVQERAIQGSCGGQPTSLTIRPWYAEQVHSG